MRVGFTGTRNGMTKPQEAAFIGWIEITAFEEFHHGLCVGADEQAALHVDITGEDRPQIVGYPCTTSRLTSWKAREICDEVKPARKPLDRNHDIVDATDQLLACVAGAEVVRSGTWATVRYARKVKKRVTIIWPDGIVEYD